jgi:hypothetical protein
MGWLVRQKARLAGHVSSDKRAVHASYLGREIVEPVNAPRLIQFDQRITSEPQGSGRSR